jgi:hypothetical protein
MLHGEHGHYVNECYKLISRSSKNILIEDKTKKENEASRELIYDGEGKRDFIY